MVNGVRQVINNSDKKIILSAAVFPDQLSAYLTKGQDWQQWVYNRSIDELYPMAYFGEKERVYRQLQAVANSINSTEATLWAGLGAYIKDAEEIKEEVEAVLPLHFKGISLFSLGHIQQKKEKTESYFNAITKPFQFKENQDSSTIVNQDFPENFNDPDIINALKLLQHDHPKYPLTNNFLKECVLTRKKEFFDVLGKDILPLITEIQNNINLAPPSLKMRGYLRFVHRYDSEEKRQEQLETSREARKLIISGKNPFTVATQYSQAGGRSFGAPLPIKYISDLDTEGQMLLQLKPGEVSQIFKKADGYWFYQILGKDGVKKQELQDIPWPARRILLRDALARRLSPQQ